MYGLSIKRVFSSSSVRAWTTTGRGEERDHIVVVVKASQPQKILYVGADLETPHVSRELWW